jgi:hypothetical protein
VQLIAYALALVLSISPGVVTISGRMIGLIAALRASLSTWNLQPGSGASGSAGRPLATASPQGRSRVDNPDQDIIWQPVISVQPRRLPARLILRRHACWQALNRTSGP